MKSPKTLVCIPCYNAEDTIVGMIESLMTHSDADLLLIDDHSRIPLESFVPDLFAEQMDRITIVRPEQKAYSGGGKNQGIRRAIEQQFEYVVLLDADLELPERLISGFHDYFRRHPNDVLVAPSIEPAGNCWQYADTVINFSTYLPTPGRVVSAKSCLAGYGFAINVRRYRESPVFHMNRYGGEDVLYFHDVMRRFDLPYLPMLNGLAVRHLPPRASAKDAKHAQKRYGKSFFSHSDGARERLFARWPSLHYVTPRFLLMLRRVVRRRRFRDLLYSPLCWYLDFARARGIVRLSREGFQDPDRPSGSKDQQVVPTTVTGAQLG